VDNPVNQKLATALLTKRGYGVAVVKNGREALPHINPHWPIADACIPVPGYDVPILPASGVINAAIYWAIRAEQCGLPSETAPPPNQTDPPNKPSRPPQTPPSE